MYRGRVVLRYKRGMTRGREKKQQDARARRSGRVLEKRLAWREWDAPAGVRDGGRTSSYGVCV